MGGALLSNHPAPPPLLGHWPLFSSILFLLFFVFSLSPVFRSEAARPCCVVFQLLGRRRPVSRWPRWRPPSALILSRLSSSAPLATIRDYATNHHHHHHHRHN